MAKIMKLGWLAALLALSSCSFRFEIGVNTSSSTSGDSSESSTSSSSSSTTSETTSESTSEETSESSISSSESTQSTQSITSSSSQGGSGLNDLDVTPIAYCYNDLNSRKVYNTPACPSKGEVKPIVIPIWFTDSENYISMSKRDLVRDDIDTAYFGDASETGWHSMRSFYEEESLGMLYIDGITTDWYECGRPSTDFYSESTGRASTNGLVKEASDWFFANNPSERRISYDTDLDGYLDAVMLIYAAPCYPALRSQEASNLWAYCYWLQRSDYRSSLAPGPNTFFWASYCFLYGYNTVRDRTGFDYYYGDTRFCEIDAHTFIHEMGHVFGLDDYYDYGPYGYSPAASFSMQDHNVGGHDPFSLMAFGWADPFIPTESCTLQIRPFATTNDVILLSPEWNAYDSPFDEYLLLELFAPIGTNEFDCVYGYGGTTGPNSIGLRVWHVDARLVHCEAISGNYPVYSADFINDIYYPTKYGVATAFSNTVGEQGHGSVLGSEYDNYDLLHLIRNSKSAPRLNRNSLAGKDLFRDGDTFSMDDYSSQFLNGTQLDNGLELGWSFSVEISGTGEDAVATIDLTRE